jgi:hypothetical protein
LLNVSDGSKRSIASLFETGPALHLPLDLSIEVVLQLFIELLLDPAAREKRSKPYSEYG